MDIWFASNENFEHIASKNKEFIVAIKGNRLFAKNLDNKYEGKLKSIISCLNLMLI